MGQRFLEAMPCEAILFTIQSWCWEGLSSHGFTAMPMIDITWDALNLFLTCLPLNCSPHTSPISEDPWGILDIGHSVCCLICTFCRVGNQVAACSWKSFKLDNILRICLPCLLQVAQPWWELFLLWNIG